MASTVVYFVSEQKQKAFSAIHENVIPTDLYPYMLQVQDLYLQDVLGSSFYNVLKEEIRTANISEINSDLIDDYIAPFVLNAVIYQFLPWQWSKMMNKGIITGTNESPAGSNADLTSIKFLRDQAKSTMDFYRERLRRELVLNQAKYPDYVEIIPNQNMLPNRRTASSFGFTIPRTGSKVMNQNFGNPYNSNYGSYDPNRPCDNCDLNAPPSVAP